MVRIQFSDQTEFQAEISLFLILVWQNSATSSIKYSYIEHEPNETL